MVTKNSAQTSLVKSKDKGISKLVVKSFENEDKPVCKTYEKNGIYWPGWDEGGKEE